MRLVPHIDTLPQSYSPHIDCATCANIQLCICLLLSHTRLQIISHLLDQPQMKMKTRRDTRKSRRYMRDDAAGCTIVRGIRAKGVVEVSADGDQSWVRRHRARVRVDEKRFLNSNGLEAH